MGKKNYKEMMQMLQKGAFPMFDNKNSAAEEGKNNMQKENIKSTVKSAWKQRTDRKKYTMDNRREQWKKQFDYRMKLQDTFADSLPDDVSSLPPFLQVLPISPKAFMEWMKEFQIMAFEHYMEQAASVMDFFIQGQEQFFDLVSEAMEKKEDESAQTEEEKESAEDGAEAEEKEKEEEEEVKKPRTRAAQKTAGTKTGKKTGTKTGKKTGTKTGKKTGTRKKAKAAEIEEDNDVRETAADEVFEDIAVQEAEAEAAETVEENTVNEAEENTAESQTW